MARLTQAYIDAQRKQAEETMVAETKSGVIVIAHPGQKVNPDRTELKHEFGIMPDVEIKRLIDTAHAPPLAQMQRQLELQDLPLEDQIAAAEANLNRLRARRRAEQGRAPRLLPPPDPDDDDEANGTADADAAGADPGAAAPKTPRGKTPAQA